MAEPNNNDKGVQERGEKQKENAREMIAIAREAKEAKAAEDKKK